MVKGFRFALLLFFEVMMMMIMMMMTAFIQRYSPLSSRLTDMTVKRLRTNKSSFHDDDQQFYMYSAVLRSRAGSLRFCRM